MSWILLALLMPDAGAPPPTPASTLPCGSATKPAFAADVVATQLSSNGDVTITINAGSRDAVTALWGGVLLDKSGNALPNGVFCIQSVRAGSSKALLSSASTLVESSAWKVHLYPP